MDKLKSGLAVVLVLVGFGRVALADHDQLSALARELGGASSTLYQGAANAVGQWPSFRQRYAFEHVSFLHDSAHRFEQLVGASPDDHALLYNAYAQLQHDAYNARQTFNDLFYRQNDNKTQDDHGEYQRLLGWLNYSDNLIARIGYILQR